MKHLKQYTEFVNALALSESTIIEGQSTIGITTHDDAVIDGIDDLTADLDKARIKYKYNRLTRTLSVFNMDKRFFKKAKKIIDDSGFGILLAKESVNEAYTDEERKALADKGFALSDGSFPIKNLDDLKNAIQAYGRAKDQARAAKFIVKRAKALGAEDLIPDTEDFQKSLSESIDKTSDEDREHYDFLLTLRDSGKTNMFGAAPYLQKEFGMSKGEARKILAKWMKRF
jgi:hypothetical protein|tara:strand:- start:171 stop:857 length:687 start_codon:yes stop_codon:yes gene_type:complete